MLATVGREGGLDLAPELLVNDAVVLAFVKLAAVRDLTDVDGVLEQGGERTRRERDAADSSPISSGAKH